MASPAGRVTSAEARRTSAAILLVGAGKMGGALLKGWLAEGWGPNLSVLTRTPTDALRATVEGGGAKLVTSADALPPVDLMVLAIKPQMLDAAAPSLAPPCGPGTALVSVLAGRTVADLSARLPVGAVIRAMPNTPAAVGRGITGAFAGPGTTSAQRALADALLGCVGPVEWLEREDLIDAVTAVSGSGPAYVFLMVEALAAAGRQLGLDDAQAMRLARATVEGAGALLVAEPATGADQLRRNVTSPGGTTAAALAVLQDGAALERLMQAAVAAARDRARALAG